MKNCFKSFAVVVVLVVVGSACGGGGAKVDLVPVATELRPTPNGYAFANFPASASPEEFNADDLAKMFGSEACVDGVVAPCDPIAEAAAWARMVNQARASGQCEGMVVEASQRFDLSLSPPTVDLVNEGEVTHEIIRTFATQFLPEVQEETLGWGEKSLAAIVTELVESFKTGKAKYSMGLYIEQGGHALLPYAVEFPTPDLAVIQLYDSNWPGKNRYVEVDLKAKQWRFSFSGKDPANDPAAWTGGQGFMDLTSLDTRGNSTCPFCASGTKVKNSMIVISSVDTDWSISNANGRYSPGTNNLVEGIVSRPIRGSVSPSGVKALEYVVFVEGNDLKLDLPNTTSAFISQGSAVVQVSTSGKNSGTVTITEDTVSVDDPNVNVKVASADLVADIAGNNTVIGITEKQLDVSVESSTGQTFTVAVNQETPQVSARAVDTSSSSAPTNFVITTQTSDNQVQVREVARDGSETVVTKQASAETDLNNTAIELAPALQVSTVKPGLPPLEDRDLKNPEYKADESFVPKTGLVVSKLAEVVVLNAPTTVPIKNTTAPDVMNSFGPTTLVPASTTTVPPSSTTTTPTTLPTTTTVKPTTTTVKPVVRTTTTTSTTSTVPPTTTTSSTTTTTSSTTTTTSTTTTVPPTTTTAPPIYSAPPDTTTTTTSTTTTTAPPTAPGAPTSVSGTSGNGQVLVSWTAPASNGGAAITDYIVQYSTSASGTYYPFSDGTSTATTATVTGLTNGTSYYFKVAATNSVGTGDYSAASATVTPALVNNGYVSFSYMETLIYQQVVVSDMANTTSQTIAFKARYGAFQDARFSVFVNLYNSGGDVLAARVACPAVLTDSYQTFSCVITPASVAGTLPAGFTWAQIGRITVQVYGDDGGRWGGNYGPVVDYVSLVAAKTNGPSTEQLLNHDFNTVTNYAPDSWTISSGTWAACSGLYTSSLCVGFADTPFHDDIRTLTIDSSSYSASYRMAVTPPRITSTASAGTGTKTYSSSTTSVCTINSSTGVVAFVSVGTCTIGASIAADSSYITASASAVSFSVVYAVGDTGPGGGKIFIIPSTTGNSTGKYFEAAPTSWSGGADPTVNWCYITNGAVPAAAAQGTSIGLGQGNSTAIGSYCSSGAAVTARAYRGGGFSDWFLPSEDELKALQVVQETIGGFASATYWSSTEIASGRSGAIVGPTQEAYPVHFPNGGSNLWYKSQTYHVRPVRMFSPTS